MFLLYIVVAVCLVFVVFIRVIVALGVGCRILLSYFYSLSFDVKLFFIHSKSCSPFFIHRCSSFAFQICIGASLPVADSLNLKPPRVYLYPVRSVRFGSFRKRCSQFDVLV